MPSANPTPSGPKGPLNGSIHIGVNGNGKQAALVGTPKLLDVPTKPMQVMNEAELTYDEHKKRSGHTRYQFKSKKFQQMYEGFLNDPDRLDLRDEISLLRTILATTVEKIGEDDPKNLKPEQKAQLVLLSREIGALCEQMSRIHKTMNTDLSIEHLKLAVDQLVTVACKYIPEDKIQQMVTELRNVRIPVGGLKKISGDTIPKSFLEEGSGDVSQG